jgi:hypothetical protein
MKAFLMGASAAVLAGCTCPAPLNLNQIGPRPVAFQAEIQEAQSATVANAPQPQPARSGKNTNPTAKSVTYTLATNKGPLPPAQLEQKGDPVIEKAKAAIRAMMDEPASAEFGEIRRVVKNLLGEPVNTICGHVKGKNASGGDTGEMAFLYIVYDNEAYLVDGNNPMAETGYRNLCE